MPINRTVRYAAKQAYQLFIMTGRAHSTMCGFECDVHPNIRKVNVHKGAAMEYESHWVPIANSWMYL